MNQDGDTAVRLYLKRGRGRGILRFLFRASGLAPIALLDPATAGRTSIPNHRFTSSLMEIRDLAAIDVHAHYGKWDQGPGTAFVGEMMSGDAATVIRRAQAANTEWTVVSPLSGLMPRGCADAVAGNEEANSVVEQTPGLLQWVIVHPLQLATFDQARERLQHPKCVGIKIHPEEHCYPIREHGRVLFELAAELDAVVLTHSGHENSMPDEFVTFADDHPNVQLILAHIGCRPDSYSVDLQVRAVQASRHGNIFADTSSSNSIRSGLIEWAVAEIGADRVLYGTDTPLYFSPSQRARIDGMEIPVEQKRLILRDNAERLLQLP